MVRWLLVFLFSVQITACSRDNATVVDSTLPEAAGETVDAGAVIEPTEDLLARAQAPLLDGLGDFTHPITTADPAAQRYFDQGMIMAAGFNHAESVRAFRAAQRLDPTCAMCFWGEALAIGPNINVTAKGKAIMLPDDRIAAFKAIQRAQALAEGATEREQD